MAQKKKIDFQRQLPYPMLLKRLQDQERRIEELEDEVNMEWSFNLRQFKDCAFIALHKAFGFGETRNAAFEKAVDEELVKWMRMSLREVRETEQGKDCEDFWVTQHKMDDAVREARGQGVLPWEVRYDFQHLATQMANLRRTSDTQKYLESQKK